MKDPFESSRSPNDSGILLSFQQAERERKVELINIISAKSIWLFDINDLNPRGKDIHSELIDWLKDNYYFDKAPSSPSDVDKDTKGLKFERGRFQIKEEIYIAVDLEIYNDGIVAKSRSSTHDTEKFVEDLLHLATKEFSLPVRPDMVRMKMHTSELTIHMDSVLFNLNPKLLDIANTITSACGIPNIPLFEVADFGFSTDLAISHFKPAPFLLQRKIGAPFSEKRYYSIAPLHTEKHQ